jgi:transcriptional pleiotropic repressor
MAKSLLEKSRAINKILAKIAGNPVDFFEIADVISKNLECSCFVVGRRGSISGYAFANNACCVEIEKLLSHAERFPESFNQDLLKIEETKINIILNDGRKCIFNLDSMDCSCADRIWCITPVFGGAGRIGTIILMKEQGNFTEEDIVLAEYGALVMAIEIMRIRSERIKDEVQKKASVQIAMASLSFSETEAIEHILAELKEEEGLVVASRIADKAGITRSVIVSALRKFESAGVIESRSLGMKGTYIKVLNNFLFKELKKPSIEI